MEHFETTTPTGKQTRTQTRTQTSTQTRTQTRKQNQRCLTNKRQRLHGISIFLHAMLVVFRSLGRTALPNDVHKAEKICTEPVHVPQHNSITSSE